MRGGKDGDHDYQAFLRFRREGMFKEYDSSWVAVIQWEQLIAVVALDDVDKIPRFDDANTLVQPITDQPPVNMPNLGLFY